MANTEGAWKICETDIARPDASVDDFLNWSALFAARNLAAQADRVLTLGIDRAERNNCRATERTPESVAALLRIERVILTARTGQAADALKQLQELEQSGLAAPAAAGDVRPRLNSARLAVAEQLLSGGRSSKRRPRLRFSNKYGRKILQNSGLLTLDGQLSVTERTAELDKAETLFRRLRKPNANNAGAWMGLGQVANIRDDTAKAAEYVERAAALAPNSASIQLQLAQLNVRLGRYLPAEKSLLNVLSRLREEAKGDRGLALELLANCYIAGKRPLDAEQTIVRLESVASQDPAWTERIASLKSSLLLAKGSTDPNAANQAQAALRQQYAADPDNSISCSVCVSALQQANLDNEAEQVVKEYAQRHEGDVKAWLALARFYLSGKEPSSPTRLASASEALTRALVVDPDSLPALRDMVEVQVRRGNLTEALALCDRYLERAPNDQRCCTESGSLLARTAAGQRLN